MKKFQTVFFNGYKKDEVEQYIESLISEFESFKEEANRKLEEERKKVSGLQNSLEAERGEKLKLQEKVIDMDNEKIWSEEKQQEFERMEKKVRDYESRYASLAGALADAKLDAEKIRAKAQSDAVEMTTTAKEDADSIKAEAKAESLSYRDKVERELEAKRQEDSRQFKMAKYNIMEYLDSLNRSQSKLIETYNELGELVKRMPIRLADVFSEKPDELLTDRADEEKEKKL